MSQPESPFGKMNYYHKLELLGEGSYASVFKGISKYVLNKFILLLIKAVLIMQVKAFNASFLEITPIKQLEEFLNLSKTVRPSHSNLFLSLLKTDCLNMYVPL